jgi:hypothetical protein
LTLLASLVSSIGNIQGLAVAVYAATS